MASRNQRKKRTNKRAEVAARSEHVQSTQQPRERSAGARGVAARASEETKSALRTTELIAYAATVLAIVITSLALDADGEGGADPFGAEPALRYITYLTIGYMLARGLAKAGSWQTRPRRSTLDPRASAVVVHDDGSTPRGAATNVDHVDHVDHDDHVDHVDRLDHDDQADHDDHDDQADHGAPRSDHGDRPVSDVVAPSDATGHVDGADVEPRLAGPGQSVPAAVSTTAGDQGRDRTGDPSGPAGR